MGLLSAVLVTTTSGATTVTVAEAVWFCREEASLVALTVAVLGKLPVKVLALTSAKVVVPVMWTEIDWPAVRVLMPLRLSVPLLMVKSLGMPPVAILQVMLLPNPAGNGSFKVTP